MQVRTRLIPSILLVLVVSFFLFSAMASIESELGAPILFTFVTFASLLFIVFWLEALEVSVLMKSYNYSLETVKSFLTGRQALLLTLVFLLAASASFPLAFDFPFSAVLPQEVQSLLVLLLLKWGLAGSVIVLFFGQQLGKLFASKNPSFFLRPRFSRSLIRMCCILGRVSVFTLPDWIVKLMSERATRLSTDNTLEPLMIDCRYGFEGI